MTNDEIRDWCRARRLYPQQILPRERVTGVLCDECGADRDENCRRRGDGGYRVSNHLTRVFEALRAVHVVE